MNIISKFEGNLTYSEVFAPVFQNKSHFHHNFFNIDKAAIIKNAIPAHHRLPVRNQTTKATKAAGISTKSKRITRIMIRPIMIRPISPNKS